jgi:hypothetical protein
MVLEEYNGYVKFYQQNMNNKVIRLAGVCYHTLRRLLRLFCYFNEVGIRFYYFCTVDAAGRHVKKTGGAKPEKPASRDYFKMYYYKD